VQPDESWSACIGVKAGPESGTFNKGRGGGQQGLNPPIREVAAALPLGVQEDWGKEGREKHLPFCVGDVGVEPQRRGDVGEVSQTRLQGGAEQEGLVLPAEGKEETEEKACQPETNRPR
jgi:hypothetical protein